MGTCVSILNKIIYGATRGESNADPERQIQTRSTTQQTVFDAEPTTSQWHANYEVENPVIRQRHREADLSALQHEREEQEGLKQQQYQKIVEQQELQELHRQTQKIQTEQELRRKLFEEQWLEKQKIQELQQQHQLEQLCYKLKLREQSQNAFDRNDKLVVYRLQDSEMGHILTNTEEQGHLYGQKVDKSESHQQELDEVEGSLTDHSKTMMIGNEIIVKDNQQYQCKREKWNEPKENLIESSSFDRDYYIVPKEQQTLEAQLQEQQQNLQKPHILMHSQPQREVQQRKRKRLCNEKPRKEFEWGQLQRRLNLFSDESGLDNIFDNKLVRKISKSELKGKQILALRDSGDRHNLYYNNGNRGQYQPQNSMNEQPTKEPRAYTEVGSTQTNPPKSPQPQSLHEFKPEDLAKSEQQQNSEFHKISTKLYRDDGETKRIMVNPKEQLPPEVHEQGLNERGGCEEIEIGTEIREIYQDHTQYNTDANKSIMNENDVVVQSYDIYQQYRPKIKKLYKYSKTFVPLIENFVGTASSDEHYYIEESLTRILLELDRLPAENCQKLRLRRRKVIKYIYDLMGRLDDRVQATQ